MVEPGSSVAVTGATGFIGSHIVDALLKSGYNVVAITRSGASDHLSALVTAETAGTLEFRGGDLLQPGSYDAAFEGCQGIVHCAAVVSNANAVKSPQREIVDPSVQGTENVVSSITKMTTPVSRVVQISSVAAVQTYDKPNDHAFTEADWNDWSSLQNGDPYGVAKTEAERVMMKGSEAHGFECVALNPSIVFGPCLNKAHTKASPVFLRQLLFHNEQPDISFTIVDVRDVAAATVRALALPAAAVAGKRFILAGDDATHWLRFPALAERTQALFPQYSVKAVLYSGLLFNAMWYLRLSAFEKAVQTVECHFDNAQSKDVLGVEYHSLGDTLEATVKTMVEHGVKPKPKA